MKIIPNINYKSVLAGITNLHDRNDAFNALDKQSQRLEIAWDSLQLVITNQIKPADGYYWNDALIDLQGDSKKLQKTFNTKTFFKKNYCEVCQRGALMLSQIRLGNDIDSDDTRREKGSPDNMKGFTLESFLDMEREYEHSYYNHPYMRRTSEKMANILCNVLVNGDFNTKDTTDYLIIK